MDEPLINELLLVGAALGSTETAVLQDNSLVEHFLRGENCLEWLQDLQRALRRDDDTTREVAIKLGKMKVVETKLIPLLSASRDDVELVVTLVKLFVMLTMPLSPAIKKRACAMTDPKSAKLSVDTGKRRDAALLQCQHLSAMKRAFTNPELFAILVAVIEKPLSKARARKEEDTLIIELTLTLLRNILCIEDICAASSICKQRARGEFMGQLLHAKFLVLLDSEYVLDILLYLCQGVQSQENAEWNLLLMEILYYLYRDQEPEEVARAGRRQESIWRGDKKDAQLGSTNAEGQQDAGQRGHPAHPQDRIDALQVLLTQEKVNRWVSGNHAMTRHGCFGSTLYAKSYDGQSLRILSNPFQDPLSSLPQATRKRRRKEALYVDGDSQLLARESGHEAPRHPLSYQVHQILHTFSRSLIESAYEPFVKSLKAEFRRDSSRLEAGDRSTFFYITGFLLAFSRHTAEHATQNGEHPPNWVGSLIHSMDVLSFNLVLSTIDSNIAERAFAQLHPALVLYKEMISMLSTLAHSVDGTYQHIAAGLQHKLFYASEPVDKLHKICSCWKPGIFTRRFLADLIELCEYQLCLLADNDRQAKAAKSQAALQTHVGNNIPPGITELLPGACNFDSNRYFLNLCTNLMVRMCTHLLEGYFQNSRRINHHVLAVLERMRHFDLTGRCARSRKDVPTQAWGDVPTLEPLLWNAHTLTVAHTILVDPRIAHLAHFSPLIEFARSLVRNFGSMVNRNPLVMVEALFQHSFPHIHCENLQQSYCALGALSSIAAAADGGSSNAIGSAACSYPHGVDSEDGASGNEAASKGQEEEAREARQIGQQLREGAWERDAEPRSANDRKKARHVEAAEEETKSEEEEWDEMLPTIAPQRHKGQRQRRRAAGDRQRAGRGPKHGGRWTQEEDAVLRENYPAYANSESGLYVLAKLAPLEAKGRSSQQIKRRLRTLGLLEKHDRSSIGQSKAYARSTLAALQSGSATDTDSSAS